MTEPEWLTEQDVLFIHHQQLFRHRGAEGLRDRSGLLSGLDRPVNKYLYEGDSCDLEQLGAAYAFGICRNHPFVDGNKRTAFLAMYIFLRLNGYSFAATEIDAVITIRRLAAGDISETELADWLRRHAVRSEVAE